MVAPAVDVVAVSDHVNLTWRSPLTGPNDDSAGPRFPSMTGIYLPELMAGRLSQHPSKGMIVRSGVVAGVFDPARLNAFETETVETHAYAAVSSELVPVVIVAAHLGLRVAGGHCRAAVGPAAVVVASCTTKEWTVVDHDVKDLNLAAAGSCASSGRRRRCRCWR